MHRKRRTRQSCYLWAEDRANLLEELAKARNGRWTALGKAVKELNKRLDGQLRVEFEPARIRAPLKAFLLDCHLEGIGDKRLAWIDDTDSLSIPDIVDRIRQGGDALLNGFKKAGMQKQVADAMTALPASKLRVLEELDLPERMELLLNVSPDGDNYREVGRLSTGQQCTAILHLLLLDNPDPLVIDQPEDNLDNAFIADHIVNELRASKTKRQFLFATHNANIPVFGDAEWIGVLQEEDGRAKLRASGSIDALDVKELAANILEGGSRFTDVAKSMGYRLFSPALWQVAWAISGTVDRGLHSATVRVCSRKGLYPAAADGEHLLLPSSCLPHCIPMASARRPGPGREPAGPACRP